jgi:histidinol-phosphatase (PHP family)
VITSYHNHTNWSDGDCTLEEQIEGARAAGLDELGISDHYVLYPGGQSVEWSITFERLGEYVRYLEEAAAKTTCPILRVGIEADFFPGTVERLRNLLALYPFDYVIGSVHFVDGFPIDEKAENWDALSDAGRNDMWRRYWGRVKELAESGVYDFLAHPDLPKKFGHRPTVDVSDAVHAALDAIARADMAIEINTAGWHKPVGEAYPTLELLMAARKRDIPLLINADAHSPGHLVRDFERARALAREAGYAQLVRYEKRRRYPNPL